MAKIHLTAENYYLETRERPGAALLDFGADWCGYCRRIAPAVEAISEEYGDDLTILEADIDELPELAREFQVEGVPTFVYLQNGQAKGRLVGPDSKAALDDFIRDMMD